MMGVGLVFSTVYNIFMKFFKQNIGRNVSLIILTAFTFLVFVVPIVSFATSHDKAITAPKNPPAITSPSKPIVSTDSNAGKIINPLKNINSIPDLIQTFLEGAIKIAIPVLALAIIYCGFLFVFARGKAEKLTNAKNALLYTIIGAAVLLGAWAIAQLIVNTVTKL